MQLYTKDLYPKREQRRNAVRFAKKLLFMIVIWMLMSGVFNSELIECAFEKSYAFVNTRIFKGNPIAIGSGLSSKLELLSKDAQNTYKMWDSRERLVNICNNIISNKGIFIPAGYKLEVPVKN